MAASGEAECLHLAGESADDVGVARDRGIGSQQRADGLALGIPLQLLEPVVDGLRSHEEALSGLLDCEQEALRVLEDLETDFGRVVRPLPRWDGGDPRTQDPAFAAELCVLDSEAARKREVRPERSRIQVSLGFQGRGSRPSRSAERARGARRACRDVGLRFC